MKKFNLHPRSEVSAYGGADAARGGFFEKSPPGRGGRVRRQEGEHVEHGGGDTRD